MVYWRLFYHLVWGTKNREDLLSSAIEEELKTHLAEKAKALGCLVHAVGVMPDHVHVVGSVPPAQALSDPVGRLKGGSAHYFNNAANNDRAPLVWQNGYGVVSFGEKQLPWVVEYVHRQKEHHQNDTELAVLEKCQEKDAGNC